MNSARSGFTLIELLIVVALIGILVPVIYNMAMGPLRVYTVETTRTAMQDEWDKTHRMLDRDIRSASKIISAVEDIRSSSTSLILEIPFRSEDALVLQPLLVHYHFLPGERTLVRDVYQSIDADWRKDRTYPLSRDLTSVEFVAEASSWEDTRLIGIDLLYKASIAHTDLTVGMKKYVALRGGE